MAGAATTKRATPKQLRDMITELADKIEDSDELNDLEVMAGWTESEREWQGYTPEQFADEVAELAATVAGVIRTWLDETRDQRA